MKTYKVLVPLAVLAIKDGTNYKEYALHCGETAVLPSDNIRVKALVLRGTIALVEPPKEGVVDGKVKPVIKEK